MNYLIRWIGFTANWTHDPVCQENSCNYYQTEAIYLTHRYT